MSDAALPHEPERTDFIAGSGLSDEGREIIGEWLESGAFEEALLQIDIEDLEIQRRELEYKLQGRDEARLPSTE